MTETPARPRHTTLAATFVMAAGAMTVVLVAEQLSGLGSLDTRDEVSRWLDESPETFGLDVDAALAWLRTMLLVTAGLAATAAVLGWHVLQRSRGARIGLTVVAVPLFLGGLATGGVLTTVVAVCAVMLWLGPSAVYFGDAPPPRSPSGPEPDRPWSNAAMSDTSGNGPDQQQPPSYPPPGGGQQPPPTYGQPPAYGQQPPAYGQQPPAYGQQPPAYGQQPGGYPQHQPYPQQSYGQPYGGPGGRSDRRPGTVTAASIITIVASGLAVAFVALIAVRLLADKQGAIDDFRRGSGDDLSITDDQIVAALMVVIVIGVLWSLAAIALAIFAMRRSNGARIALVVSASVTAVGSLLAIAALFTVVTLVAAVAVIVLLFTGGAGDWYRGRAHAHAHQPGRRGPVA